MIAPINTCPVDVEKYNVSILNCGLHGNSDLDRKTSNMFTMHSAG